MRQIENEGAGVDHNAADSLKVVADGAFVDQDSRSQTNAGRGVPGSGIVAIPLFHLRPGNSPRLEGEDKAHIARLAETETPLPPILVERRTMRVIDGMHRLLAASLRGQDTVDVEFFHGSPEDAFLRAVETNVTHGLPLSLADRRSAAARIVTSHPHMSDRAIGRTAGLAASTVAAIRRHSANGIPQRDARVGRDGRVRPLNWVEGRRRAADLLAKHPGASLREVARGAGVSPATVRDVRGRLERGEEPVPVRPGTVNTTMTTPPGEVSPPEPARFERSASTAIEKLLRDPSLRQNEQGRRLLRVLQSNAVDSHEWAAVAAAVPPHCTSMIMQVALQYAQMWQRLAQELDERARICEPWGNAR